MVLDTANESAAAGLTRLDSVLALDACYAALALVFLHAYVGGANHTGVADNKCGRVCPGEGGKLPARLCGGGWRNAVFAQSGDLLPVR